MFKQLWKLQHGSRSPKLELHGPRNGLSIAPRSSRVVQSAPLFAQPPNPPTKRRAGGAFAELI
eukprot:8313600-Alexandrium_andersonii.AAC.1